MSLRYPIAVSGFATTFPAEGVESAGGAGFDAGVPLGTISHEPAALGAATWLPLHPASHSISTASKAAIGRSFKTRSLLEIQVNQAAMRSARPFSA